MLVLVSIIIGRLLHHLAHISLYLGYNDNMITLMKVSSWTKLSPLIGIIASILLWSQINTKFVLRQIEMIWKHKSTLPMENKGGGSERPQGVRCLNHERSNPNPASRSDKMSAPITKPAMWLATWLLGGARLTHHSFRCKQKANGKSP